MEAMNPQQIRRVALELAVEFTRKFNGSAPEDLLYAADIFAAYIEEGSDAALRIDVERGQPRRTAQTVELREQPLPMAPPPRPAPEPDQRVLAAKERVQSGQREEPKGGDPAILAKLQRVRKERAEKILREWKVAKAPDHQRKLIQETHEAGLEDFVLPTDRGDQPLGQYMRATQGS